MEEDDYIVRMPPLRSYPVRVKIKSVTKGTPRFALEDEVKDAMEICEHGCGGKLRWDELGDEALETLLVEHGKEELLAELKLKAHVGDEALGNFEELTDQSAPPVTLLDKIRYWTLDDWIDWLMGLRK